MGDNTYCVYMHTLLADGRKYIGITKNSNNPNKRWYNGAGYKPNTYFYNIIQKYGWDSFKHEILFENLSKEQACNKEKALIKLFHTTEHDFGFNLTSGGEHYEASILARKKMSDSQWLKVNISYEELYYQYIKLNKSQKACAEYFDCSITPIRRLLVEYNIKKPKNAYTNTCRNINHQLMSEAHTKYKISKEDLYYQYIILNKTQEQCADYFGCCKGNIQVLAKKYDLRKGYSTYTANRFCTSYTISKEDLYYQYIVLDKTRQQCADYFKVSKCAICKKLHRYHIVKLK